MFNFSSSEFEGQTARTMGKCSTGFAEPGEVWTVAGAVRDGDVGSWKAAWEAMAKRLERAGKKSLAAGREASARACFARACEYYRQSWYFSRESLDGPEAALGLGKQRKCFAAAAELSNFSFEIVDIPVDEGCLGGYLFLCGSDRAPLLIALGAMDTGFDEAFSSMGPPALERGYHVLVFDAPGQGRSLYGPGPRMFMRPEFEAVLARVLGWAGKHPKVDENRMALMGQEMGAFLAARGACLEHSVAALVLDPGLFDLGQVLKNALPAPMLDELGRAHGSDAAFAPLLEHRAWRLQLPGRMAALGQTTLRGFLRELARYSLEGLAENIACPTLVCANQADGLFSGQATALFEALSHPKDMAEFTMAEGAGGRCQHLAREVFFRRAFDWLDAQVGSK